MPQTDLGPNKWALIHARRQEDLSSGLVVQNERSGFAGAVLGERGWTKIYEEIKHYEVNAEPTSVRVYFNDAGTHAVKLDDRGALIDQASALVRLKQKFAVCTPNDLTLVTDGGVTLLLMKKMDLSTGHAIQKRYRAISRDWRPEDQTDRCWIWNREQLKGLYQQGKSIAAACTDFLVQQPFDVIGLHKGNWGVRTEVFTYAWGETNTLRASDVVIFDPVSMRYAWPPTVVKSRQ